MGGAEMISPVRTKPVLQRQHSRVPGGFDTDDDLSPIKTEFDISDPGEDTSGFADGKHDYDQSGALGEDGQSLLLGNDSIVDDKEMARKLMEIESSFLPELSPFGKPRISGSEDDYITGTFHGSETNTETRGINSSDTPEEYETPAPGRHDDIISTEQTPDITPDKVNTSSLETMSSSPTVAAAARTVSRAISLASIGGYETAEEHNTSATEQSDDDQAESKEATPKSVTVLQQPPSPSDSPTPRKVEPSKATEEAENGDIDEEHTTMSSTLRTRPKTLSSRQASQRSSYSSYTSNTTTSTEGASDLTIGAEYALQTGGAMPYRASTTSRPHTDLMRSISLSSMASGVSNLSEGEDKTKLGSIRIDGLQPLAEEGDSSLMHSTGRLLPLTPTPATRSAINGVVSGSVPQKEDNESQGAARDRRDGRNTYSPDRRIGLPTPGTARGKNLTLKEQSSTIDKLQKENWDLKLRIKFMDDLINQRSEEGVNAIMSENVNLRTDKVKARKEIRELKSLIRDLEFRLKKMEETKVAQAGMQRAKDKPLEESELTRSLETEVDFLRERVTTYQVEIEKLRIEGATKDGERRRLAEAVKAMSDKRAGGSDIAAREEMDMWRDLLETETARREQAEEQNKSLQDEISRLKAYAVPTTSNNRGVGGPHPASEQVNGVQHDVLNNGISGSDSSTLIEHFRHENADLRRDLSAQASMLTSRNRERDRLYQEIEDLKMGRRRGDGTKSIAGDSILDRSVSRTYVRPGSRASDATPVTQISEAERESYETQIGELRDQISALKIDKHSLAEECDRAYDAGEQLKGERDELKRQLEYISEHTEHELLTFERERDEALAQREDYQTRFKNLQEEAQQQLDAVEDELDQKTEYIERLETELANNDDIINALRNEVRMLSEGLNRVEAEVQAKIRRIQEVELENEDINRELEGLEKSLREGNEKSEKLTVELESRQNECAFLREEQDGCMLKIGDLEAELKSTTASLSSEKGRSKDLEARLAEERRQREIVGTKEKQEVQKILNDQNRELSAAKEALRKLNIDLEQRESEVTIWKDRMTEYETGFREVLGDPTGSRSSLLTAIVKLQSTLENTSSELDKARHSLSEKERLLQRRDALLESHGLESQKLSDLLEKERSARRADKAQHEQWQKTHQHTSRTVSQKEARIAELEAARQADRKKVSTLEAHFKDQLLERNNLLLAIWHRLATMCGTDWQHQNSLVSGHLPTVEVVSNMLPGFSKNLLLALKTVEAIIGGFKNRIKGVERDLMKDFQSLEHNLDMRIKRLDRLEAAVQVNKVSGAASAAPEIAKLRGENRVLKAELAMYQRQDMHSRQSRPQSNGSSAPNERGVSASRKSASATLMRHHSTSEVETRANGPPTAIPAPQQSQSEPSQQRWIHRLRELERRLKAEREARLLDRSGARKRLEEERAEAEELRAALEREKVRSQGQASK